MSFRDAISVDDRLVSRRRKDFADIKYRLVVRPRGDQGLHVVKNRVTGQEFTVSGPRKTFKPDSVVPTGSNTGNQGEQILIEPPPGLRGPNPPQPQITTILSTIPSIIGDFGQTDFFSSGDPMDETYNITGTDFSASNFPEMFGFVNADNYPQSVSNPGLVVTETLFLGKSVGLQVRVQAPFNFTVGWRFRVFTSEGSGLFAESPDPIPFDSLEDAHWSHVGL